MVPSTHLGRTGGGADADHHRSQVEAISEPRRVSAKLFPLFKGRTGIECCVVLCILCCREKKTKPNRTGVVYPLCLNRRAAIVLISYVPIVGTPSPSRSFLLSGGGGNLLLHGVAGAGLCVPGGLLGGGLSELCGLSAASLLGPAADFLHALG